MSYRSINKRLGNIVKGFRKSKGLTQCELADILGVSQEAVSKIESGKQKLDAAQLLVIINYFDESIENLLGGLG